MDALTSEELRAYFDRVGLTYNPEATKPTLHLLCKMHFAHVQTVPYENLSLHLEKVSRISQVNPVAVHHLQIFDHTRGHVAAHLALPQCLTVSHRQDANSQKSNWTKTAL